jgi:Uma2 family endonuclease
MAIVSTAPLEEYLATSYPDGDREYLDGMVVERNLGTPEHSALQGILIEHLAAFKRQLGLSVLPECRTRIHPTRYRVPDVLVMTRPFRRDRRMVLDPPLLIVEILSPEDRTGDTLERFREYEKLGARYIVLMDPERRTTHLFLHGDLVERPDLSSFEIRTGESLPFPASALLAKLDEEPAAEE